MLEALPVEIIEQVFLYCLNLNLPRASRVLATALSREHLYKVLIILAFWDDRISEDQNPRSEPIDKVFLPLEYVPLQLEQRRTLQEQIFRCKWCTRERIQEQIPQMMNLTVHRQWINAGITMDSDQQAVLEHFMVRKDNAARTYYGEGPPWKMAQWSQASQDPWLVTRPGPHEYKMHIIPNEQVAINLIEMNAWISWPALDLLIFPPHLLRGRSTGFTEGDILFLEMLRVCSQNCNERAGRISRSFHPYKALIDREALHEGVSNAIRTQNFDALTALLKIDEFNYRFSKSFAGDPKQPFYTIPSYHFITATRYGRDNPGRSVAIFEALIRASAESLPATAGDITEWIIELSEDIARKGLKYPEVNTRLFHWLPDFMARLPSHIQNILDGLSVQIFYCGSVVDLEGLDLVDEEEQSDDEIEHESQLFVNEVLKPERHDLANYMFESPYKPADFW